jgi:DNA-directed RNA polymerase subunit RPC12/RpoP
MARGQSLYDWCKKNKKEHLLEEWDDEKNKITPKEITCGSREKAWWKCEENHSWRTKINNRTSLNNTSCPYCSNNKVLKGDNDLTTTHPNLSKQWHPKRNKLKPEEVTYGSGKEVWWKCELGHEYKTKISSRSHGSKCPYCAGKKVLKGFNDLETKYPKIAKEWNYKKNKELKPYQFTYRSNEKIWWKCRRDHEWEAMISSRTQGGGCPYCSSNKVLKGFNDLETKYPETAKEWNYEKNKTLKPFQFTYGSNKKIWWKCKKGHEWEAMISSRTQGRGCPYCSNKKVLIGYNDLATTHSDLAKQWHLQKNKLTPEEVTYGSGKKVWWICEKGHEWKVEVSKRTKGINCPYCSNKKVLIGYNDLATTHSDLAKQWHPQKNKLTPEEVTYGSGKIIWWKCEKGHDWKTSVNKRTFGTKCPYCMKNMKRI